MWSWLLNPIIGLLGGPVVNGLLSGYKARLDAGNTTERISAELAQRELAVQQAEIDAHKQLKIAQIGHWWEVEKLFAYVLLFYFSKVYIYDAALGLGTTDPVTGAVGEWAGVIVAFYFAKRGFENVARIIKA